jgi:hypothetical protein
MPAYSINFWSNPHYDSSDFSDCGDCAAGANRSMLLRVCLKRYRLALATPRRSPLTPLKKGGTGIKVPLFKGDLGGSAH